MLESSLPHPPSPLSNPDLPPSSVHTNNEVQDYTVSNSNLQITGGGSLQLIPRKSPSGAWTSGRIESKYAFTPQPGKQTIVEGKIRFGDHPASNKQGIWPAFWLLGDSIHQGTPWPRCGELDIMETINGAPINYGTIHCGNMPGGPCNEPIGRPSSVGLGDNGWHTWSLKFDRTNSGNWRNEVLEWSMDGRVFNRISGQDIGDEGIWGTLAHSPLFVILNVAVGGDWYVCSDLRGPYFVRLRKVMFMLTMSIQARRSQCRDTRRLWQHDGSRVCCCVSKLGAQPR